MSTGGLMSFYNEKLFELKPLFKECIDALEDVEILPISESISISKLFKSSFPITEWGKINWEKIDQKIDIGYDPETIIPTLKKLIGNSVDTKVYIEWSTMGIPVIKT